jgi:DNA-binding response OmpR family regulator
MPSASPNSVLVADPSPDAGLLYARILDLPDDRIAQVTDGRDAIVKALAEPPSLVIAETVLPFIDGYALCEILRREHATQSIPILVITADARASSLERALASGADGALVKPFDPDVVRVEVDRLLRHSRGLREQSRQLLVNAAVRRTRADAALQRSSALRRKIKSAAHARYETASPPVAPPTLHCPRCDGWLAYTSSHVGGVNERFAEQWDQFRCPAGCGNFQFRHRTNKITLVC